VSEQCAVLPGTLLPCTQKQPRRTLSTVSDSPRKFSSFLLLRELFNSALCDVAYLYPCRTIHSLTKRFTLPHGCDPDYISSRLSAQGILLVTCPRFVSSASFLSPVQGLYPGILLVTCPRFVSWYPSTVTCPRLVSWYIFCQRSQVCILVSFLSPVPRLYPGILLVTCPTFVSWYILLVTCPRFVFCGKSISGGYIWPIIYNPSVFYV
jgi:hypothetical protein